MSCRAHVAYRVETPRGAAHSAWEQARLVFVLYAEDRGLMPRSEVYQKHYSISGLFERLRDDEARSVTASLKRCWH